jgi:hypothetical protein
MLVSRRTLLTAAPAGGLAVLLAQSLLAEAPEEVGVFPSMPYVPAQDPELVQRTVGFAHANVKGLRELVESQPELAKATWDWGFGDWETAIGAASHTGNRENVEILMAHGARPDIFTFAMLGNLDAIRAMIKAQPGVQRLWGPHSITLLKHAKAGGEQSKAVYDYLLSLGDADDGPKNEPLTDQERQRYIGLYSYGPGSTDQFEVSESRGLLTVAKFKGSPRNLFYQGNHEFMPAGARTVRIRFDMDDEVKQATRFSCYTPEIMLTAQRTVGC